MKKKHALITAGLSAMASAVGFAGSAGVAHADPTTVWNGATETREEDRRFHVSGRFMYDVADTDADFGNQAGSIANQSGIRSYARRAFLGADGRLTTNWRYNIKFDISFGSGATVKADDFYLEYAGQDYSFIIGNNNAVSPMEDRDSSLNIPFNERSFLISASGVGKKPGIAFITNGGNWSWGVSLQSQDGLDSSDTASNGTEAWFTATRFTWAPIFEQTPEGTTLLHLGIYARYRDIGDGVGNAVGAPLTYSPNALSPKFTANLSQVGGAGHDTFINGEVAFQWNAFGADAEFGHMDAADEASNTAQQPATGALPGHTYDASWSGYYVDVFWSPTGESRRYNAADGSFGAITPRRTLGSDGGIGHIMLSGRYEDIDLTDTNFGLNRNETTAWTIGATWVPISHVKFQLNYSDTQIDYTLDNHSTPATTNKDNEIHALILRSQFDW